MPRTRNSAPDAGGDPYANLAGSSATNTVSFAIGEWGVLGRAIEAVTRRGDGFVCSRTSDGGAVSVRVLHDKLVTKWYATSLDELDTLLGALADIE